MTLPRIDELREPAVVGRYYLVPTVKYRWGVGHRLYPWPVIGPKHEDAEIIGFTPTHYHVDGRFLTPRQWVSLENYYLDGAPVYCARRPLAYFSGGYHANHIMDPHPPIVWRRKRCYRADAEYPIARVELAWLWLPKLRRHYEGSTARTKDGRLVCPHRGAPLTSFTPDEQGNVTCPLHGLRWCAATGLPAR